MTAKMIRRVRIGLVLAEEWEINGQCEIRINGAVAPVSFHEAIIAAKQAPLVKMRDECRRLAKQASQCIELDAHDVEEMEHDDY